jgi:hypothetical protein
MRVLRSLKGEGGPPPQKFPSSLKLRRPRPLTRGPYFLAKLVSIGQFQNSIRLRNVRHKKSTLVSAPKSKVEAKPVQAILLVSAIFFAHVMIGVILYRGRAVSRWAISDSDFVIFELPFILAAIGYFYVFRWMPWLQGHRAARMIVALVGSFLSWWAYMLIALNTYGS